jgi:nicotinate-nucleotide adenylyltransferase
LKLDRFSPPRWNEVTAVFGGRFDPPHLGHREAVRGLFSFPRVNRVLVIPSATPPHKPAFASSEDRLDLTKINFSPVSQNAYPAEVIVNSCELDRAKRSPQSPTYTYDTLAELKTQFPQLAFVIGADQLAQFSSWYRFLDLFVSCHWIVLERKPNGNQTSQQTLAEWHASNLIRPVSSHTWQLRGSSYFMTLVPTDAPAISSTQIRETLSKEGIPPANTLLPEVWAHLKQRKLYGINKAHE